MKREKERVVIYVSPVTKDRLDLLRSWSGARARGEAVDIAVDLVFSRYEDEILAWAQAQFQKERGKR